LVNKGSLVDLKAIASLWHNWDFFGGYVGFLWQFVCGNGGDRVRNRG